ncbi:MAG: site-specific integrase [Bacteroidales bacterium]|nr:site-specific integrase [Bacteroidales bacterium]
MPVYKYTLKNGKTRWYASFYATDWTGERRRVVKRGFKTQREAKEYERSCSEKQGATSDITFADLAEKYLDDISHRVKPTTLRTKRGIIETRIMPYFKSLRVKDIDSMAVRSWQNELLSHRGEDGKGYSNTYLKGINTQLSALMNYAVRHYGLASNPCRAAGSIGKSRAGEMQIWTRDEYEVFISHVKRPHHHVAFDILFYTGMRTGELLALTMSDVLPGRRIRINKNFARVGGEEVILTPKTEKSVREIAIPEFLYTEIVDYTKQLYGYQPDDRIFSFSREALCKEFKRRTREAGLPEIRLHDLRHSHASLLIEMGASPLEISERLGHESVKTTLDIYSHLYPDKDRGLADALDRLKNGEN